MGNLRCNVADLLPRPGARRTVRCTVDGEVLGGTRVARLEGAPVWVEVTLERVVDGIVASGRVQVTYRAECSRCLAPLQRPLRLGFSELYEPEPTPGDTYRLERDVVDLEPALRDTVLCELPLRPLCRDECAGLCPRCGADRNVTVCTCEPAVPDPRWAPLAALATGPARRPGPAPDRKEP